MPRPCKRRLIGQLPRSPYFKPSGIPVSELEQVNLGLDECEALRLADMVGLEQEAAAEKMRVSRQTFGNILRRARKKVASCLIQGKALRMEGGIVRLGRGASSGFRCGLCGCGSRRDKAANRPEVQGENK